MIDFTIILTFTSSSWHSINRGVVTRKINGSCNIVISIHSRHHRRYIGMGRIRTLRSTINFFCCSADFFDISPWAFWVEGMGSTCKYSIPNFEQKYIIKFNRYRSLKMMKWIILLKTFHKYLITCVKPTLL